MTRVWRRTVADPLSMLAIVALALGLGMTTAAFALLDDLLLSPSTSFSDPSRVLEIAWARSAAASGPARLPLSFTEFLALRDNRSFSVLAAAQGVRVLWSAGGRPERIAGEMVSADFLRLAGAGLVRGRGFSPSEEGAPGGAPVVVLGYDLWRRAFAGDEEILGRRVHLNGHPFTVIGVAAPGFTGASRFAPADFWVPLSMYRQVFHLPELFEQRDGRVLRVFGRLRPGAVRERADAELQLLGARLARELPEADRTLRLAARDLAAASPSAFQKRLRDGGGTALAASAALLFIACLDTANLLLVRARARTRETALHLALGAGPGRLAVRQLGDGLLLAALGGILAWPVALAARQALWGLRPPYLDARLVDPGLDGRSFLFMLALVLLTALLCSGASVVRLWTADPRSLLREAAGPDRSSAGSGLSGQLLVTAQVALSAVCLGLAALFVGSLWRSLAVDPGFEARRLVLASFDLQSAGYDEARVRSLQERMAGRLRAVPGVEAVALAEERVLGGFRMWQGVTRPERAGDPQAPMAGSMAAGAGYFSTVGIPLLQGAELASGEGVDRPLVVLNEALARRLFPAGDAIGREVVFEGDRTRYAVAGVAATANYLTVGEDPIPLVYLPLERHPGPRFTVHIRTSGDPEAALPLVREVLLGIDPRLPIEELATAGEVLRRARWMPRMSACLLSLLAGVAVVLAGVGVYGVASAAAQRRCHEVGVRMALGARRGGLVGDFLIRGLGAVGLGLACGLVLTLWIERWVQSLLYEAGSLGWPAATAVASILLLAGAAAHLVPALRLTRLDPALVLRRTG